jgi:hypothetical protein
VGSRVGGRYRGQVPKCRTRDEYIKELQARLGAVLNDGLSPGSERYDKIGRVGGELVFGNRG